MACLLSRLRLQRTFILPEAASYLLADSSRAIKKEKHLLLIPGGSFARPKSSSCWEPPAGHACAPHCHAFPLHSNPQNECPCCTCEAGKEQAYEDQKVCLALNCFDN